METYNYNQHKHNFSVWTSARAVQRGFTSTKNIKVAIDYCGLRPFAESEDDYSEEQFEKFHRKCCEQIIESLDVMLPGKTSYGRAAKIIAIYLKTSVVIPNKGFGEKSRIIHPPIDNILLTTLSKEIGIIALKKYRWTKLTEERYWELILFIKSLGKSFNWTLEEFWKPEMDV